MRYKISQGVDVICKFMAGLHKHFDFHFLYHNGGLAALLHECFDLGANDAAVIAKMYGDTPPSGDDQMRREMVKFLLGTYYFIEPRRL